MFKQSKHKLFNSLLIASVSVSSVMAQADVSAFFPEKNELSIAPSYTYKISERFFRGIPLNPGNPLGVGDIRSYIVNIYAEYGITDRISANLSIPYIWLEGDVLESNELVPITEVDDFQDLSLEIKGKIFGTDVDGIGNISLGAVAGITTPLSDYEGSGVISIGNATTTYNGGLIAQYITPQNIFLALKGGYSYRDTNDAGVPNATVWAAKLGYFNDFLYLDTQLSHQNSLDGIDIGTPEFAAAGGPAALQQTENDFMLWSFSLFVPIYESIGITSSYVNTIDGRNFGKEKGFSIGLVYSPDLGGSDDNKE